MRLFSKYLAREIYSSVALVFVSLLTLFAFLELIGELRGMQGNYQLGYVLMFVLLSMPGHIYELFPVAVLIGAIVALVQMSAHSELTVFRASGASMKQLVKAVIRIGLPLVGLSLLCGELLAPPSEHMAQEMRLRAKNSEVLVREFRSGVWVKDDRNFVNARNVFPDGSLLNLSIYQYDDNYHLRAVTAAHRAVYEGDGYWQLEGVAHTRFGQDGQSAVGEKVESMQWHTTLNPSLLQVLLVVPEQMSAWSLYQYTTWLRENHQKTVRYEIAMWKKLAYPLAILVMLLLALPFANLNRRSGGVSGKIFAGIVLGLSFHFIGKLFADFGALYGWPPILSATFITMLFALMGVAMLWWTERR